MCYEQTKLLLMQIPQPAQLKSHCCFGGIVGYYSHFSESCNSQMNFAVYEPPQAKLEPVPVLYFLSGLTCTEENFMAKAGVQRFAAEYGLMVVAPDTSPRHTGIPGEDTDWDFGSGAGFYVDATVKPWSQHYQMYSYVVEELPQLIAQHFPVLRDRDLPSHQSIFGHSMGGHGALVCAFRNPSRYQSVSAFAPICAPMQCPWGQKAFTNYLGPDQNQWRAYDASELIKTTTYKGPILVDQGTTDTFLTGQLLPEKLEQAGAEVAMPLTLRRQDGYDHSYYFIATFMADHMHVHATALKR
jgi:S-formylglutathione hydrolase